MLKTIYVCDKCKKEVEGSWLVVAEGLRQNMEEPADVTDRMDLCGDCAGEWARVKASWLADKPRGKTGRKPLDRERIYALCDAGWSIEKIADDLNCSPESIKKYVYGRKKATPDD